MRATTPDEITACWAALIALVQDVHQPQYMLTGQQWAAAERVLASLPEKSCNVEEQILTAALTIMIHDLDVPPYTDTEWAAAQHHLNHYTQLVEALPASN